MAKRSKAKRRGSSSLKAKSMHVLGSWAFVVGVLVSLIAGVITLNAGVTSFLIILGLVVGFLNVQRKETMNFILASVSLVIIGSFGGALISKISVIGPTLGRIFSALVIFIIPAAIVVILKSVFSIERE